MTIMAVQWSITCGLINMQKKKKKKAMYFYGLTKRWSHGEMEPWSYAPKGGTDNQALT